MFVPKTAVRLALAISALTSNIIPAGAFQIAPQCEHMRDRIGCSCALQNGGYVKPNHGMMRWYVQRWMIDSVETCVQASGSE
jgi:hypothetical protein